jgi:hypothetical protein
MRSLKTLPRGKEYGLHYIFTKTKSAKVVKMKITKVENEEKLKNDDI